MCHRYSGDPFIDKTLKMTFKLLPLIDADCERLHFDAVSGYNVYTDLPDDCRKNSPPPPIAGLACRPILPHWHHYLINALRKKCNIMNTTGKIITGFLTGTLLGLVAGLLVAPATGKKTRKDIQKKSKKLAKQLGGYVGINSRPVSKASKNGKASVPAS